jgi:hypothetical protein
LYTLFASERPPRPRAQRETSGRYSRSSRNGEPSYAISPGPIVSIAAIMRPLRSSARSASATMRALGIAEADALRIACAMASSLRAGLSAQAADAGVAMHHHRRRAVPGAGEIDELEDVLVGGVHVAVDGRDDVVHAEDEVVVRREPGWPDHAVGLLEQRDDVAGAGLTDSLVEARERADVDHGHQGFVVRTLYGDGFGRESVNRGQAW